MVPFVSALTTLALDGRSGDKIKVSPADDVEEFAVCAESDVPEAGCRCCLCPTRPVNG